MNLKNEININKKLILIMLLINVVIIGFSTSYALFQKTVVQNSVIKLQIGNTDIETTIENYSDNLITLASEESKTLNITLSNITEYDILYQMYYTVESGDGTITTTELTSDAKGTMNNKKILAITIQNNNASDITIKVATKGALINSSITLEDNEYQFLTDIEPPVVTVSAVDNNTNSPKISITSNEDGEYCVNTSSTTTDMTNCVFSGNITANNIITTGAFTTDSTYYVHVKDNAGNIGISSGVAISLSLTASDFATEKYGIGGLIAINTSGTLYNGTGTIREYRYSGASVNNYIKFNNGEIWRIVGIFKNSSDEWNLKLMRNMVLTSSELPNTYTYGGTNFKIEYAETGKVSWNDQNTATNYNDWTTAGLQYYLNGTDGYFGTLSSGAKALVDTNYIYYLGNIQYNTTTAISGYTDERNTNNVWSGNKATWSGKVALLYPSDYGYSASSSYWNTVLYSVSVAYANTNWMDKTANHTDSEWLLSPCLTYNQNVILWDDIGFASEPASGFMVNGIYIRPVLNLLASAPIDVNHQGTEDDPYVVLE